MKPAIDTPAPATTQAVALDDGEAGSNPARTRQLSPGWRWLLLTWTVVSMALCFNQQFTLRFFADVTLLDTEYFWLILAVLLPLAFILYPARVGRQLDHVPWYDLVLFAAATGLALLWAWTARDSAGNGWEYSAPDVAPRWMVWGAVASWLLVLEALRRAGGMALLIIMGVFSLFPLFSVLMPAPLHAPSVSLLEAASFHIFSRESVLGIPMRAFAELVIGFLVFGTALQYTGAGTFFINFAFSLCGHYRGGAAKVSIFSSGLLGSMSGSVISNVLTTGTMTIPAMKRTGMKPSTAAAVEACASTGAVLAPPVMGATAFVMAEFLDIPYAQVALAAAVPAVLYYFALFMQIDGNAARNGLVGLPKAELPKLGQVFREGWYFIFVIILLVLLLLVMKRENWAPWLATALLLVLNQLFSPQRWGRREVLGFIEGNGRVFVELVAILAGVGLLVGAFSLTGLTGTLTTELLHLAGNSPLLLMLMGALTSFILGMGMTITACYIFLAVLLAPSLIKVGLDPLAVHMFIMYWGMVSFITPPVALAAFAAASVAKAKPMETGLEAMKIGSIIYFVPFFFLMNPSLLLQGSLVDFAMHFGTALIGVALVCSGLQGYQQGVGDLRRCGALEWPVRIALMLGGLMFIAPGGGLMPLSPLQMTGAALALTLPALLVARLLSRQRAG
ncbi:MAG: C4-dicarboxylate ABC transporter [Burkholderiales bacterium RIFCSPHIGHO2_12_FULL_69_20]|nr:MAG: C4-dicarboxylate ABC transporter [Burkholderiales bacterium RIFCSPHIGHO2_12_FULL_69_20]